ncbi:lytic murein transglycosylase [Enterovirga aerilata]|uniref:Lytic murein transglycosylase n=1 Tax=Enterovirga aerilata TaxID=2730920 RepID=A0A849I4Q2_9HYPH|nr:lytic murein transglycosylase [Enterovirga sp. DB1703]NNM71305.1 lytic murein transglycosylase [Enterovirga sp. DB1703]
MRRSGGAALAAAFALLGPGAAEAQRPAPSPSASQGAAARPEAFGRFLESLWPEARSAGVSRATFDEAFRGLEPDPKVVALTRRQGEFSRPISAYVAGAVSPSRISQGQALAERWRAVLDRVEASYGVPRAVVLAIWASESGYGSSTGGFDTIRSLATLAFAGERRDLFRRELLAALRILEEDHLPRDELKGSWAGAMGQTQFMPSSFLAHAVDGDGDGRRDIWRSTPDVLASIGHFLAQSGWKPGLPWGFEAVLPDGLDLSVHDRDFAEWARLGIRRADGSPMPRGGLGRLFLPAGIGGPAFLLADENWEAIRAYNTSDAYALAIGLLSDRIGGGPPLSRAWPTGAGLTGDERRELHRRLTSLGFYRGTPDGKFGAQTRDAVRRFQLSRGLLPDGYANRRVLEALRRP